MRNTLLFFFYLLFFFQLSAQEEEASPLDTFSREPIPILVEPMRYPEGLPPRMIQQLEQTAYAILENHWHFQVINHSSTENTGEIDPEYIFQLSLEPLIDNLTQNNLVDSNKQVTGQSIYITGGLSANLRVTSIVTGELKYTQDIKISHSSRGVKNFANRTFSFNPGGQLPYPQNPEQEASILQGEKNKLLIKAIGEWGPAIQKELNSIFPVMIHMLEILEGGDKKPKILRIDAGTNMELFKNQMLHIVTLKVYEALGEQFVRYERIGYFYPKELSEDSCTGRVFSRKAVGTALANGQQIFFIIPKLLVLR